MEGTRSFVDATDAQPDEVIIFGWIMFDSSESRKKVNEKLHADTRVQDLVAPLVDPDRMIFNPGRMAFGGFRSFIQSK